MDRVLKSINIAKNQNTESHQTYNEQQQTWQTTVHDVAVKMASTFVGQAMMMQFDKLLWTLEKTATWIPDGKTDGKRGKPPASLVRPLPWVFFLPTLVLLRYTRVILSLISLCFGFDGIKASTMVSFLHQSRRTIRQITLQAKQNSKHRNSSIESVQKAILSLLSNLNNLVGQTSDTMNVHNNKTSLNSSGEKMTDQHTNMHRQNPIADDESDSEDQDYQDFLSRTLPETSDSDDDDYVFELNGDDDASDTDSQSSVATDEFSDDENQPHQSDQVVVNSETVKHVSPPDNDCNYSASASTTADQTEKGNAVLHESTDAQTSAGNDVDDVLNRLIDDTNATTTAKINPRPKHPNRQHKNGRFHAKPHNNGKHFNGAHALAKSKAAKNQNVQSTSEFIAEEFVTEAVAADRT